MRANETFDTVRLAETLAAPFDPKASNGSFCYLRSKALLVNLGFEHGSRVSTQKNETAGRRQPEN
jgi:hypothetical protein